jgi:hypothetical protein
MWCPRTKDWRRRNRSPDHAGEPRRRKRQAGEPDVLDPVSFGTRQTPPSWEPPRACVCIICTLFAGTYKAPPFG